MTDQEQEQENKRLIDLLQGQMDKLSKRLTPEIEPAVVYIVKEEAE